MPNASPVVLICHAVRETVGVGVDGPWGNVWAVTPPKTLVSTYVLHLRRVRKRSTGRQRRRLDEFTVTAALAVPAPLRAKRRRALIATACPRTRTESLGWS